MMDFLNELESMAINVADETTFDSDADNTGAISVETIDRWQALFAFTENEAIDNITNHRADIARSRVSDEHWSIVCHEKPGRDKESYEFEINQLRTEKRAAPSSASDLANFMEDPVSITYLLKLGGALNTPKEVAEAAGLSEAPEIMNGLQDDGEGSQFCQIDGVSKARILESLAARGQRQFHPTFVRLSASLKRLSSTSIAPTLGVDASMPQFRLDSADSPVGAQQNEFPVWYFFYGNLAKEEILTKLLSLDAPPAYCPAQVKGAAIKRWAGKYNAMVDGPPDQAVDGWAYQVQGEEKESILRYHETGNYEVVRCDIWIERGVKKGLTFRYYGPESAIV